MALAGELRMAQAEVYEVATFYAHFDVVREGETPPPPLTIRVCDSLSCALAGAENLLSALQSRLGSPCSRGAGTLRWSLPYGAVAEVGHHSSIAPILTRSQAR